MMSDGRLATPILTCGIAAIPRGSDQADYRRALAREERFR